MEIIVCENHKEISKKASEIIIDKINHQKNVVLGLATGSTPIELYRLLVQANKENKCSFKNVVTFNLDEYVGLSKDHEQSYHYYMYHHLFSKIDIKKENINLIEQTTSDLDAIAKSYNNKLNENKIDIQILGIGSNGHIGFNEPRTSFSNETFIVELDEKTREDNKRFFNSIEEVPKQAITMGIKNIMKAKKIILIASGQKKAEAIKQMILGPIDEKVPASVLQLHPNVVVVIDKKAASKLK